MAEFAELMKQARRMCGSISCDICTLPELYEWMCVWDSKPLEFTDEIIAKIESKTLQWAAENPEVRYPTWQEWNDLNFPDSDDYNTPCGFMPKKKVEALMGKKCINLSCSQCIKSPIPADIAEKLGIKPKEA